MVVQDQGRLGLVLRTGSHDVATRTVRCLAVTEGSDSEGNRAWAPMMLVGKTPFLGLSRGIRMIRGRNNGDNLTRRNLRKKQR